jgi:hypothetical protein
VTCVYGLTTSIPPLPPRADSLPKGGESSQLLDVHTPNAPFNSRLHTMSVSE